MITEDDFDAAATFNLGIVDRAVNKFYTNHDIGKEGELATKAILRLIGIDNLAPCFGEYFRQFSQTMKERGTAEHDPAAFFITFELFFYEYMKQVWSLPAEKDQK